MKRIALSLLPVVGLVGCGTLPAPAVEPQATRAVSYEVDLVKMSLIERAARMRGVQVVWVNQPRKVVVAGG